MSYSVPYVYNYVPPGWNTPGAAFMMKIDVYSKHTNEVVPIVGGLRINTLFDINRYFSSSQVISKVIIIDPKSWENINKLCNYQSKKNGFKTLNVGTLHDYVYLRRKETMKLLEIIYGKNCQKIVAL